VSDHKSWVKDIQETQGHAVNYPLIGDADLTVAKLYDMIHPNATGGKRTAVDNATVRSVFIVGPDKKVKAMIVYPMSTGRNFDEVVRLLDSCQFDRQAYGRHAGELEAGPGRHHSDVRVRRRRQEEVSAGLQDAEAVSAHGRAAEVGFGRRAGGRRAAPSCIYIVTKALILDLVSVPSPRPRDRSRSSAPPDHLNKVTKRPARSRRATRSTPTM